ncbi:MAG: hypothetical protein K2W96_08185 [Gemmataceae bacterium]|nr:hypothetical protein [Gemmataceae bacterium]
MIALLLFLPPAPLDPARPAKAEILDAVGRLAARMAGGMTAHDADLAADALKGARAQRVLAARYALAKEPERRAILYVLNRIGVEQATEAMPAVLADLAASRPRHPNDMSFASYYVAERFMHLQWKKLPAARDKKDEKQMERREGEKPPPKPETSSSEDGKTTTGTLADRQELRRLVEEGKLHRREGKRGGMFPLPDPVEMGWVRITAGHAFVRLRGRSSGTDLVFKRGAGGKWALLCVMGQWVN